MVLFHRTSVRPEQLHYSLAACFVMSITFVWLLIQLILLWYFRDLFIICLSIAVWVLVSYSP